MSGESWRGHMIGPWIVVEPIRTGRGRAAYLCVNVLTCAVVGVTAYRLARKVRDGDEPQPVAADVLAEAVEQVRANSRQSEPVTLSPDLESVP